MNNLSPSLSAVQRKDAALVQSMFPKGFAMPTNDVAVLDCEFAPALTPTAIAIGQDHVLNDSVLIAEFLTERWNVAQFCGYFALISVGDLFRCFITNPQANAEQVDAARKEFTSRLLAYHEEIVMREARSAMDA